MNFYRFILLRIHFPEALSDRTMFSRCFIGVRYNCAESEPLNTFFSERGGLLTPPVIRFFSNHWFRDCLFEVPRQPCVLEMFTMPEFCFRPESNPQGNFSVQNSPPNVKSALTQTTGDSTSCTMHVNRLRIIRMEAEKTVIWKGRLNSKSRGTQNSNFVAAEHRVCSNY